MKGVRKLHAYSHMLRLLVNSLRRRRRANADGELTRTCPTITHVDKQRSRFMEIGKTPPYPEGSSLYSRLMGAGTPKYFMGSGSELRVGIWDAHSSIIAGSYQEID